MPDLLSDFGSVTNYRSVAVSRITTSATLYSNGSINSAGVIEVVGAGLYTDLSLSPNEAVADASFASTKAGMTIFAARGVRDATGKWGNYLRMISTGNTMFYIESVKGNGHKDSTATALPIAVNVDGSLNFQINPLNTVFSKPVIFNGAVTIAGYEKIVYSDITGATASTIYWIPLNYFAGIDGELYTGRIELIATDASNNYLIWSSIGIITFARPVQNVYSASPGNPLTVNWFSHHRTIAMPTVDFIGGAAADSSYNYPTLKLTFPQAVKATIKFSVKRLM